MGTLLIWPPRMVELNVKINFRSKSSTGDGHSTHLATRLVELNVKVNLRSKSPPTHCVVTLIYAFSKLPTQLNYPNVELTNLTLS